MSYDRDLIIKDLQKRSYNLYNPFEAVIFDDIEQDAQSSNDIEVLTMIKEIREEADKHPENYAHYKKYRELEMAGEHEKAMDFLKFLSDNNEGRSDWVEDLITEDEITDLEGILNALGTKIPFDKFGNFTRKGNKAYNSLRKILTLLQEWNVIDGYNEDMLDKIASSSY